MEIRNYKDYVINRVHELENERIELLKENSETLTKYNEILEEYTQLLSVINDIASVQTISDDRQYLSFNSVWNDEANYSILKGILNI